MSFMIFTNRIHTTLVPEIVLLIAGSSSSNRKKNKEKMLGEGSVSQELIGILLFMNLTFQEGQ
jgi:hypothetical protein